MLQVTGYSHDSGTCHSISLVKLVSGAPPPAPPIDRVEFYFGTAIPDGADPGAILDDGTGFATNREGGLDYGWDCDGDTNVDYSGGRRATSRDDGLGINHFDRDGTCGTTANPGRVNWQLAVPNGDYLATVDFGEEHYQHACEMEGVVACPDGEDCVVTNQPVTVADGLFTVTGYSHDVGTCHSISLVRLELCEVGCAVEPPPPAPPAPVLSVEDGLSFYFGTELPGNAPDTAVLDDGTGFAAGREGGLDYGWDCGGDTNVDYSGGRRGLSRDNGLGINHFDRDGTCGTTADPGRVNWQIAVPNGEYNAIVDFGEVGTAASILCEVEGAVVCPEMEGEAECVYMGPVMVSDGFFTVTGFSHDTGACHSISLVRLEPRVDPGLCPVAAGTASGTVNIGDASTHSGGDCAQHSWGHCDMDFNSPACDPENIYEGDENFVGIAYAQQSSMPQWDGVYVSSCLEVGFGAQIMSDGIRVLGAASDESVCGVSCTGQYCGTSGALHVFTSDADTDTMPDYTTFSYTGTVNLPVDTASAQGDGVHHDTYDGVLGFDSKLVKWAALCRGGGGAGPTSEYPTSASDTILPPAPSGRCLASPAITSSMMV